MSMFCYQCQESSGNIGCSVSGVCGKNSEIASLQDDLVLQVKNFCAAHPSESARYGSLVSRSLFMTITNANFSAPQLRAQIARVITAGGLSGDHSGSGVLACADVDLRSLRELLTYGIKGIAAYISHAAVLGYEDAAVYAFMFRALGALTTELSQEQLLALVLECGEYAVKAMALLDQANTSTFGQPEYGKAKTGVGQRPGILVSGHDLLDLQELLEQSAGQGIDVYTHGEMLPAHFYPAFKKYSHLYGNYGNAWHKQGTEFAAFNGPILLTTNCLTPVRESYQGRLFTTGETGYPDIPHIADRPQGGHKDFSAIIALAKSCPPPTALEDGEISGGFAHHQVLALADKVIAAVKSGAIKRFIVMAGCDGRQPSRDYFREVAESLPKDTIILTAGCAKYRYNK
ncbi:MAG: hydroxylamine reductase, partial [Oligosphaeraceae bacterium]|nr:hydroxylamine reductase [Oligosphaeraceae bacterium]